MASLPNHISDLSQDEKLELLDAIWEDIETHPSISPEQEAELDRRIAAYEKDPSGVVPWERVRARLPKR